MFVKEMTKMLPKSTSPASGITLTFSIHGYLQQEAYLIIDAWSMQVFRNSVNFPDNLGYFPSIKSTFTLITVYLSSNGAISSNHLSR